MQSFEDMEMEYEDMEMEYKRLLHLASAWDTTPTREDSAHRKELHAFLSALLIGSNMKKGYMATLNARIKAMGANPITLGARALALWRAAGPESSPGIISHATNGLVVVIATPEDVMTAGSPPAACWHKAASITPDITAPHMEGSGDGIFGGEFLRHAVETAYAVPAWR